MKDLFDTITELTTLQSRTSTRGYKNENKVSAKLLISALNKFDDCENYANEDWLNQDHLSAHDRINHLEDAESIVSRIGHLESAND